MILLHVVEPFHVDYAMIKPFEASLRELAQAKRAKTQEHLDAFALCNSDVKVTRLIAEGDPATQILECSESRNVSLLVMPTQGHSRLRAMVIDSVTTKVLDCSDRPVLTGRHLEHRDEAPDWRLHNILCAVDLGTRTPHVLEWGTALAKEFEATATVLHVASNEDGRTGLTTAIDAAG